MTVCHFCGDPVNPLDSSTYRCVVGWERKADVKSSRKGGRDISCVEPLGEEFACWVCIDKLKRKLNVGQTSLI